MWISHVDRDHDLAEGMTVTDVGKRVRYLVESVRAVDADSDLPSDAQLGEGLELPGAFPHSEYAHPALVSRPAIQPTVITSTSARMGPPTQR